MLASILLLGTSISAAVLADEADRRTEVTQRSNLPAVRIPTAEEFIYGNPLENIGEVEDATRRAELAHPRYGQPPARSVPTVDELIYGDPARGREAYEQELRQRAVVPSRVDTADDLFRKALAGPDGTIAGPAKDTSRYMDDDMRRMAESGRAAKAEEKLALVKGGGDLVYGLVLCVIALSSLVFLLMLGKIKQFKMGLHLTRMTNVFEAVERTRHTHFIGAGGGIDSLPKAQQIAAKDTFERASAYLKNFPRHEVTRVLVKNKQLADRMGRRLRAVAICRLVEVLVEEDLALGLDDFLKSYS